jgi:hypothetical protein
VRIEKTTKTDEEFGKALCDRLGLRHDDTLPEWSAESVGTRSVAVKMTTFKIITEDEFNELRAVAVERAA